MRYNRHIKILAKEWIFYAPAIINLFWLYSLLLYFFGQVPNLYNTFNIGIYGVTVIIAMFYVLKDDFRPCWWYKACIANMVSITIFGQVDSLYEFSSSFVMLYWIASFVITGLLLANSYIRFKKNRIINDARESK